MIASFVRILAAAGLTAAIALVEPTLQRALTPASSNGVIGADVVGLVSTMVALTLLTAAVAAPLSAALFVVLGPVEVLTGEGCLYAGLSIGLNAFAFVLLVGGAGAYALSTGQGLGGALLVMAATFIGAGAIIGGSASGAIAIALLTGT